MLLPQIESSKDGNSEVELLDFMGTHKPKDPVH